MVFENRLYIQEDVELAVGDVEALIDMNIDEFENDQQAFDDTLIDVVNTITYFDWPHIAKAILSELKKTYLINYVEALYCNK